MSSIILQKVYEINAPVEVVRSFIYSAERARDGIANATVSGILEEGKAFYAGTDHAVTLYEIIENETTDTKITRRNTLSFGAPKPYTIEGIKRNASSEFIEVLELQAAGDATKLIRTWRDLVKHKRKWMPIGMFMRNAERFDAPQMIEAWNAAAKRL